MSEQDKYYQVLGLNSGAPEKEIIEAYKVLVKVWHPDRFSSDPDIHKIATEKIKEIDEAFKQILIEGSSPPGKGREIQELPSGIRTEQPVEKGSIVIQTEPLEAKVYFNEKFVGASPLQGKYLTDGSYRVRVIKDGYEIWEQDVTINTGAEKEVFAKLKQKEPESGEVWKDPYLGMEFVFVKAGSFEMGDTFGDSDSDEKPVHKVFLDDFWIGKYQVTQDQWKKVMGNNPSYFYLGYFSLERNDYPVENISWEDTQDYIRRINQKTDKSYRLPTEAEWEYAARSGGKKEKWAGTSSQHEIGEYVWYSGNSGNQTHPVGQKKPNSLGLYDMSGNVNEWVLDLYDKDYDRNSPMNNPCSGHGSNRVIRGGSFYSGLRDLRTTSRSSNFPKGALISTGFRLVLPAQQDQPIRTEKEQPPASGEKAYGTPTPSRFEPIHEPASKSFQKEDLKDGIKQNVVSPHIVEYAGFWKRFAAFVIDCILVSIIFFIISFIFGYSIGLSGGGRAQAEAGGFILGVIIPWLYWAVMESSSIQATVGKVTLGIIVTDYEGKRISFGRATGRHFSNFISTLILLIGYVMAGFTKKKQALHDMIAGCLVIVNK